MEGTKKTSLKRKAQEISKDDLSTRIRKKLHHELQAAQQAAKKAKAFEIQRLVKKLKGLRKTASDSPEVKENETQLELLKDIDVRNIANTAYRTKLLKDKTLRENDTVLDALEREVKANLVTPADATTSIGKVQSRLLSSKALASQIAASLESLTGIIDPDRSSKAKKAKATSEPSAAEKSIRLAGEPSDEDEDEEGDEDEEADGWESGSVDDAFAAGLAPEDSDGSEEGSEGENGEEESGTDDENSDEESDEAHPSSTKNASKSMKPSRSESLLKATSSTFLPSLQTAYISGSDDDSDIEGEAQIAEPRKNRRGQRARRAIWEKKFGRNANHKKVEAKTMAESQAKRSQQQRTFGRAKPGNGKSQSARGPLLSGSNLEMSGATPRKFGKQAAPPPPSAPPPPPKASATALHPSWEARKRLKEKESISIVPSQGKKIVF